MVLGLLTPICFSSQTITYDEIGNPLSYRDGYQFTWQYGRRLSSISHNGDSISYTYDPDGIRTSKTVNGNVTKFHTMNDTLLGQTKGSDKIIFLYNEKANRYGFDYNGTKYYYIFNVQGDVIGILNQAGQKIVSYTYDPWGKVLSVEGSEASAIGQINPIRYRGYYYDTETGFYYLQTRYYDPNVRRFLNTDAITGVNSDMCTYNLYAYCGNNPISRYDNTGMFWKKLIRTTIHVGHTLLVAAGIDTAAIGAFFLNMEEDGSSGVYHADFNCWQQYFGYNDIYDVVFDIGTSMEPAKFPFSYNGQQYMIWAWKGDYINLGAGAELGIYYGGGPHWLVDKNLAMQMQLYLSYKGTPLLSHSDFTWWITAFDSKYLNVLADDLTASFCVWFHDLEMYLAFYDQWHDRHPALRFNTYYYAGVYYQVGVTITI